MYDGGHIRPVTIRSIQGADAWLTPKTGGCVMAAPHSSDERAPLGQRLLDHPFLLLVAGLAVMFGFYTLWGLYEILSLPKATLP
jgi:hypothetical protein